MLIYGKNAVIEAIKSGKTINKIYFQKGSNEVFEIVKDAMNKNVVCISADKIKLDKMITEENEKLKNSQGIVANITDYNYFEIEDILKYAESLNEKPKIVILDKIEDPHNLGAIIRSINCLGFHGCIIQKRNACQVTDTVEKVAAGALSYVRVARVTNITETIKKLKEEGLWIYGLDMDGKNTLKDENINGAIALVIGNEGNGITRLVKENCDVLVKIPMSGDISSLNASVSAAIAMYEVIR